MGFFKKIKEGLKKTRDAVVGQIDSMLKSFTKIDDELFEELEELLVMGDVGVPTAEKICKELRESAYGLIWAVLAYFIIIKCRFSIFLLYL